MKPATAPIPPLPSSSSSSSSTKTIADEPQTIELEPAPARPPLKVLHHSSSSRRLTGRPPVASPVAIEPRASRNLSESSITGATPRSSTATPRSSTATPHSSMNGPVPVHQPHLITQVREWLAAERAKRAVRRERRARRKLKREEAGGDPSSGSSDEGLDALETILQEHHMRHHDRPLPRRLGSSASRSAGGRPRSAAVSGSDTEYMSDGEPVVPECEVALETPEEIGWDAFKLEALKLAHTLKCKGWRRVALDRSKELTISRISGALTNAVYMVSPPANVPPSTASSSQLSLSNSHHPIPSKPPAQLLLRIYGPQASHLVDRQTELSILRRLARNKIGPRMLGTFNNGRFEEFFRAATLTRRDIRHPNTSRHIAKRLKELHRGIDLDPSERRSGPAIWKSWEKWLARVRDVCSKLPVSPCGSEWAVFESAVDNYRKWLVAKYGGEDAIKEMLVFAHNDTQYGNILRLEAPQNSPLLKPQNEHRQLVVIDFEYASANTPAYEFCNHFCEWMADYHNENGATHVMRERAYPSAEEQRNCLTAYTSHTTASSFALDGAADDARAERERERAVERLMEEVRWWRPASHAMWAAWGIVQAKIGSGEEEAEEFDYLGYARERAMLFWGDLVALGVVAEEDLPEGVRGCEKRILA